MGSESDEPSSLQKLLLNAYKPHDPIPYSAPPFQQASADDYVQCMTPRQLLARFPYSPELAVKQIRRELEADRLQGVAHQAIWRLGDDVGDMSTMLLGRWVWWLSMPPLDSDFWDTGYLEVWVPHTIHEYKVELQGRIRLFGVRFWPGGDVFGVLPDTAAGEAAKVEAKAPVSDADLSRWHSLFTGIHASSTEDLAIRSAQAMFPDSYVSRQRVRDLRGPQKRGKPTNR